MRARFRRRAEGYNHRWREATCSGRWEFLSLLLILLIVIIIFGAGKLPQLGKGIGEGIRNFRDSLKGDQTPKNDPPKGRRRVKGPADGSYANRVAPARSSPVRLS